MRYIEAFELGCSVQELVLGGGGGGGGGGSEWDGEGGGLELSTVPFKFVGKKKNDKDKETLKDKSEDKSNAVD
jgi:hypothetical protein